MVSIKKSIIFCAVLLTSTSSFAQVKQPQKPQNKPTSTVKETPPSRSLLDIAKTDAEKDLSLVNHLIEAEINKAEGYDACKKRLLSIQKQNDEWLINNYSALQEFSQKMDSVIQLANEKISSFQNESIEVLSVQGQNSEQKVDLGKMIDYFRIYNGRLKTCSPESKAQLILDMEGPENNKLNIAHSQIVAAMKNITANMNASLKEHNATYEIVFTEAECGYSLLLKVNFNFNNQNTTFDFPLLSSNTKKLEISDAAKWAALSKFEINQTPIDGLKRFAQFLEQGKGACNLNLGLSYFNVDSPLPFVLYQSALEKVAELKKAGRTDSIIEVYNKYGIQKALVEIQRFDTTQQAKYLLELYKNPLSQEHLINSFVTNGYGSCKFIVNSGYYGVRGPNGKQISPTSGSTVTTSGDMIELIRTGQCNPQ